jgi:translation initiation factor 1
MSKHKVRPDGLAYSTNSDFFNNFQEENTEQGTLPAIQQKLRVKLDSKQRAGKIVTLVEGFVGTTADLEALGKQLKTKCGTGGSVKEGIIIIQGDYKEKLIFWLKSIGFGNVKCV